MNSEIEVRSQDERRITSTDIVALNAAVGWWPERTSPAIEVALRSSVCVGVWSDDTLIGFARAITDGSLRAYVEDVMVHPDRRGIGIAAAMMRSLMSRLEPIEIVSLFCGDQLVPLYVRSNFAPTRQVVLHRTRGATP